MVMNHISDSYDWHFFDYEDKMGRHTSVSIPLPIILYIQMEILTFFCLVNSIMVIKVFK